MSSDKIRRMSKKEDSLIVPNCFAIKVAKTQEEIPFILLFGELTKDKDSVDIQSQIALNKEAFISVFKGMLEAITEYSNNYDVDLLDEIFNNEEGDLDGRN